MQPHYGPPDASRAPRYTGIRTFARRPASTDFANAHVGVPFDTATSFRPGARFGPAWIREDGQLADGLASIIEAGATPPVLDGDHSIVLGELRAHARVHWSVIETGTRLAALEADCAPK